MDHWRLLLQIPTWYLIIIPQIQKFTKKLQGESSATQSACRKALYDFFEEHLSAGDFCSGSGLAEFDAERMPIDTVVIHHTSNPPGISAERLSAIELMRLYGPYFADPPKSDAHLKGKAIFSGHARGGKQIFWPYHWIVRNDGRAERLLSDSETGWHAGNWEINCRSVAIVLDNDYENSSPSEIVLRTVAALITDHYADVPLKRVFGHREVNKNTLCPSAFFLRNPLGSGWKENLIERVSQNRQNRAA